MLHYANLLCEAYQNMRITAGYTITLPCHYSAKEASWQYRATESALSDDISRERLNTARFLVQSDELGNISLQIRNAQLEDTGWYDCVKKEVGGSIHTVILYVSGKII